MYYLYVKTHNKTGLKYLGKTVQDPFKYKGSGKYWLNHIKKHGNDVSTEILGQFNTNEELAKFSIKLSEELDIVNSTEWANIRPESGDGGDTSKYIDYSSLNRGKNQTYEQRYGIEKAQELKKLRAERLSKTRKNRSYEDIYGQENAKLIREQRSKKQAEVNKNRILSRCACIFCHKEMSTKKFSEHLQTHQS